MWASIRSSLWWGREQQIQYFADVYPVRAEAVGYRSLFESPNPRRKGPASSTYPTDLPGFDWQMTR